ncbi:PREDICTED: wall-associated receptor kinase-like 1-like [Fragaria vesca subsp. vesca]
MSSAICNFWFIYIAISFLILDKSDAAELSDQFIPTAKPNCQQFCGDVSIPYPFGIGPDKDCYFNNWYQIDCNEFTKYKPVLRLTGLEVLSISIDGTLRVNNPVTFYGLKEKEIGGCMSTCDDHTTASCVGINCCQVILPPYLTAIATEIIQYEDISTGHNYAFLIEQEWFLNNFSSFRAIHNVKSVPVVLDWSFVLENNSSLFKTFERFIANTYPISLDVSASFHINWAALASMDEHGSTPYCRKYDATTSSANNMSMLQCSCPAGFQGNPYLLQPCQDVDECQDPDQCKGTSPGIWQSMDAKCQNFVGGYECYSNITSYACKYYASGGSLCYSYKSRKPRTSRIKPIISGVGLFLLLIGVWCLLQVRKKRKNIQCKAMFFKRNGGLLLEQQLSSSDFNIEKIKLFKFKELEKSTDNFNIDRVVGRGGQGTVYKGMLADGRIVAIKKSEIVDEEKRSEFINELVILSQINHRNVVRVLGCCLETEVPFLVYEFIPNGTLSQYIAEQIKEFQLTWKMRLQIATEIAGALSYLHSAASFPIYHRDIKSTNILLDEKYSAKLVDFGTSKLVSVDRTHMTTLLRGTCGYLDPEYFQSNQFTDKSDVYSFGVVLVELLTGQNPISTKKRSQLKEYKSLTTYFINAIEEDRLFEVVDPQVSRHESRREIMIVAQLAKRCLNLKGKKRPTMREVTTELEAIQFQMSKNNF